MNYDQIRHGHVEAALVTPLADLPMKKDRDKFRGCLIGGAAGDALGYAVEFLSEKHIFEEFGPRGITEYALHGGLARISDDTQMTMFTANGLLYGTTRGNDRGIMGSYPGYIAIAYRDWYQTQTSRYPGVGGFRASWLLNVPQMFALRAPGGTCMSAIREGCKGTPEDPINNSKGCGGVMRVAPIGLYFGQVRMPAATVDMIGADAAALTHGHEMGYIPAAMLVHIIRLVAHSDTVTLKEAVLDARAAMEALFPEAEHLPGFLDLMDRAVELSERDMDDLRAIHRLGEGWCGDEALAVAVYCALKYADDFDRAIITSVNHGGDSDSTGAITGNILGAYLGLSRIPEKYRINLELAEELLELADDLYEGYNPRVNHWNEKYSEITYRKEG